MSVRRIGLSRRERPWDRLIGSTLLTHQLQDGPLAAWPMQETSGTIAYDASGNGCNGTYTNVTLGQSPLIHSAGYSASYPTGVAAYCMRGGGGMLTGRSAVSIEAVAMRYSSGTARHLFSSGTGSASNLELHTTTTNKVYVYAYPSASGTSAADAPATGTVAHYVLTFAYPGFLRAYVNGVEVVAVPTTTALPSSMTFDNIGNQYSGSTPVWNGHISHAAFYAKALTADDVLRHAKAAGLA